MRKIPPTDFEELIIKIAEILERLKIPYAITGGYAVSIWGRPRATFDIDVVVKLFAKDTDVLVRELRDLSKAGYIDEIAVSDAVRQKSEFNFIHGESGIKIDFWVVTNDPIGELEIKRRIRKRAGKKAVYFISPEDLILSKLRWYQMSESTRQLEDIESILKISGKKLDYGYLHLWAKKLGVFRTLQNLEKQNK